MSVTVQSRVGDNDKFSIIPLSGGSGGTIAAGATVYLGPAGQMAGAARAPFMVAEAGNVTGFYAAVVAAPGAAKNFTYTVMYNGAATSMTGTISGAASFDVTVTTNQFAVAARGYLELRVVTDAAATATYHRFVISLEK